MADRKTPKGRCADDADFSELAFRFEHINMPPHSREKLEDGEAVYTRLLDDKGKKPSLARQSRFPLTQAAPPLFDRAQSGRLGNGGTAWEVLRNADPPGGG